MATKQAWQAAYFKANDEGRRERFIHLLNLVQFYLNPRWAGYFVKQ